MHSSLRSKLYSCCHESTVSEDGPVELEIGKICGKRWKIIDKLGEGGCGSVYKVQDIHTMAKAALKAESNFVAGGSALKLEVEILKRLDGRRYVAQLLQAAKKREWVSFLFTIFWYSYMVMTLFGQSLNTLLRRIRECSVSTQVRVGINILYGLKQLHEVGFSSRLRNIGVASYKKFSFASVGYVHRDIKPANLAIGRRGQETRIIHMLDFGLAREYVIRGDGTVKIRIPRTGTLFRSNLLASNYFELCDVQFPFDVDKSILMAPKSLRSMVYVLAEMRGALPWDRVRGKEEIGKVKMATSDTKLCRNSPKELLDVSDLTIENLHY
ncbi:unnamed protein product, partial [Toxocara canis]|uniref:Protein kinase domain-containing protein n=1 Tax=Toxocara canis TaxID=6265 RepID=A0A183V8F3_TOXCA